MRTSVPKLAAVALLAACQIDAPRPPLKVDGSGLVIDETKGTIKVNDAEIPKVGECLDGSVLAKQDGKFSCVALSTADVVQLNGCSAGQVAGWDGTKWACLAGIDSSSSPVVASCAAGKFIRKTSSGWECADALDAAKTPVIPSCPIGQFVQMGASGWACAGAFDAAKTPVVAACEERASAW